MLVFNNDEENEDTPSLFEDISDTARFKLKMAQKSHDLKAKMKRQELERQKRREKINKMVVTK